MEEMLLIDRYQKERSLEIKKNYQNLLIDLAPQKNIHQNDDQITKRLRSPVKFLQSNANSDEIEDISKFSHLGKFQKLLNNRLKW